MGHLLTLGRLTKGLPKDCTVHAIFVKICHKFPNGLCYMDVWPYTRPLLIVSTPQAALQVQQSNLSKDEAICAGLNKLMGGKSLLTSPEIEWKKWRGIFNPGFSTGYILECVPLIVREAEVFRQLLRKRASALEIFKMEEMTLRLTMDVIGAVAL